MSPSSPITGFESSSSFTFTLKRSGRVVRKVEGAPPVYLRNWKPATAAAAGSSSSAGNPSSDFGDNNIATDEDINKIAELLYICKPLIHLGGVATFGYHSWKSWLLALATDLFSLRMYYTNRGGLSKQQKVEVSRRCVGLLLYLMRSPFYNKFSDDKITSLLDALSRNIPLARTICNPLLEYIPQWQSTYFYMWST